MALPRMRGCRRGDETRMDIEQKGVHTGPLVSVVMPAKNGGPYVDGAIKSIIKCDYRPIEIIVIDDHSVDNTAEIVKSYKEVRYIAHPSQGIPRAYNVGIEESKGELITFLSCDDLWLPAKLSRQVECFINDPGLQYAVSRVKFFQDKDAPLPLSFRKELLGATPVAYIPETLMARRPLFDLIGKFDTRYEVAQDVDWFARAKDKNISVKIIDEVLVLKRIHKESISLKSAINTRTLLNVLRESIERKHDRQSGREIT